MLWGCAGHTVCNCILQCSVCVCACVYVCVYVCVRVRVRVCIYMYMCMWMGMCVCECVSACVSACVLVYSYVCVQMLGIYVLVCVRKYVPMYACMYVRVPETVYTTCIYHLYLYKHITVSNKLSINQSIYYILYIQYSSNSRHWHQKLDLRHEDIQSRGKYSSNHIVL